ANAQEELQGIGARGAIAKQEAAPAAGAAPGAGAAPSAGDDFDGAAQPPREEPREPAPNPSHEAARRGARDPSPESHQAQPEGGPESAPEGGASSAQAHRPAAPKRLRTTASSRALRAEPAKKQAPAKEAGAGDVGKDALAPLEERANKREAEKALEEKADRKA